MRRRTTTNVGATIAGVTLLALAGGCAENEGLVGPAAIPEVATTALLPVERDAWVEGLLLISDAPFECNDLIVYVDEGEASPTWDAWASGRHLLVTLRREPSLGWVGLYVGDTAETLALDDAGSNRLSTGVVFLDGEQILSEQGGYVLLDTFEDAGAAAGSLNLGVVHGTFDVEAVCGPIQRTGS